MLRFFLILPLCLLFSIGAGAQIPVPQTLPGLKLQKISVSDLPTLSIDSDTAGSDSKVAFQSALQKQLDQCFIGSPLEKWNFDGKVVFRKRWCEETVQWFLERLSHAATLEQVYQEAKTELIWYRSVGDPALGEKNAVLFTGYYQPELKVKLEKDSTYHYPIYRKPIDSHYSRAEIVAGALNGKKLEIAFASNPVDAYLLEVQGSGELLVQNADGTESRELIGYHGSNGFPYTSLGKLMKAAGISGDYISLQGIRKYFIEEHPELWEKFSNQNQSYVFFTESKDGPYGSEGVILTPGHSIAVDHQYFPLGAIALVKSERPSYPIEQQGAWKPFTQFMISQDIGGAIRGAGHVDIFWGSGSYAEMVAGRSQQIGNLFFCMVPEKTGP